MIRKGVDMAMRLMGEQFVTGETIAEALANASKFEAKGFRYSYDMLGEAALTEHDEIPGLTSRRSTRSAKRPMAVASMKARASRSSCRPCTRATAAPSTSA
jgi:RHH-type proline utilization regulon transcriptional repressor/proline dehydrogenase/delta 1-pyrroline-5-carboxylate dehydrogenase